MADEPVTFVVERRNGGAESPSIVYGKLPTRLTVKGSQLLVYALRLDKLEPEHRQFWLSKPTEEMLEVYRWLRDEGTLPPANLADPPRKNTRDEGTMRGEASWWKPPPRPWAQS
jgi:hypothetical protein